MKRVFSAIELNAEARRSIGMHIENLREADADCRVRWVPLENLHITLEFAGELDDARVDEFTERTKAMAASSKPLILAINETGAFTRSRDNGVLWLGARTLDGTNLPEPPDLSIRGKRGFKPHITIARFKDRDRCRRLTDAHLAAQFEPVELAVSHIVVYESRLSPTGSVYSRIAEFTLGG